MVENKVIAGRYQIQELIGQGGMADVYLAYDPILHRTVAVKIMRSSLTGDSVYVNRFHREATAAAALNHKNIVSIYDVGEEDDEYYIVMEYVPGQTLKELIKKRGALHYIEAIDIMKQVLSAVSTAHNMGIIHRDLKPQNIMVTDSGIVKIGDFGIASIQSLSQVTQTDTIIGSLHYLAPEVARGERASVSSDIYALGIMFYELLRGEVPFNGESAVNIALKHMRDDIPSIHEYNPTIPQSIENIIIKATVKNTELRYQSADEMLKDLLDCLNHPDVDKLVIDYSQEDEKGSTTKVASNTDFFTSKTEIKKDEEKKKKLTKKQKIIIGSVIGGVVVVIGIIAGILLFSNKNVTMPDVVGLSQEEAITTIEDKGLAVSENVNFEISDEYEEGQVISTNPTSGTKIKKKSEVVITVSSGKNITLNDYKGYTYEDAYASLTSYGFKVNKVEESSSETEGTVISQSISAGTKISPDTASSRTVTLTVASKPKVVSVIGSNITDAQTKLEALGMNVTLVDKYDANVTVDSVAGLKTNVVISQSIDPNTVIDDTNKDITLEYYSQIPAVTVVAQ